VDREAGYVSAHEHALTGRYREARELLARILEEEPSHIRALILLGKVEYYLGHASRSRRCFETALVYDPANLAAYFGLDHYRGRRRGVWMAGGAIVLAVLLDGAAGLVAQRSVTALQEESRQFGAVVNELTQSVERLAHEVRQTADGMEELRAAVKQGAGDNRDRLREVSQELARITRETERLARAMDEALRAAERQVGEPAAP
jgi:tetratricopeptide (TPR) repeat protein